MTFQMLLSLLKTTPTLFTAFTSRLLSSCLFWEAFPFLLSKFGHFLFCDIRLYYGLCIFMPPMAYELHCHLHSFHLLSAYNVRKPKQIRCFTYIIPPSRQIPKQIFLSSLYWVRRVCSKHIAISRGSRIPNPAYLAPTPMFLPWQHWLPVHAMQSHSSLYP